MDLTVGFVSRNLVTQSNCAGFQEGQNFTYFEAKRTNDMMTCGMMPHGLWHEGHVYDHMASCMGKE